MSGKKIQITPGAHWNIPVPEHITKKWVINLANKDLTPGQVRQCQVRKFKQLQESPAHQNTPVPEHITKKWVINIANKDLTQGKAKLLQRDPKLL